MTSALRSPRCPFESPFTPAGWFAFVCESLSVSVEILIRSGFGTGYLGVRAFGGLVAMLYVGALFPTEDVLGLAAFVLLYPILWIARVIGAFRLRRRGAAPVRNYSGHPLPLRWRLFRRVWEDRFKALWEPVLVFAAGTALRYASTGLGQYFQIASVGMVVTANLRAAYLQHRIAETRKDASATEDDAAERFRRGFE